MDLAPRPTFFSLFSGIGGLDLGLERAGWRCVGQVEIDLYCQAVLAKHWPEVPRWGDICEVNPDELPRAGLVCAGFPCQPVSDAGKGLAQEDPRWLWPHVARLVRHLRPRWVLLENVPGLFGRGFGDVLGDMAEAGFDAEWGCLRASDVGAPHLRERVFILGQLADPDRQGQPQQGGPVGAQRGWAVDSGQPVGDPDGGQLQRQRGAGELVGPPGAREGQGPERQRDGHPAGDRGPALGDPAGARCSSREPGAGGPVWDGARWPQPERRGGVVGDPERQRRGEWPRPDGDGRGSRELANAGERRPEPGVGGVPDGLPARLDGHRWPAPPGPQHDWEPPRTVGRGVPNRPARVKALGNAVVPQVAEHIGRLILQGGDC